jgi:hypothetical protein
LLLLRFGLCFAFGHRIGASSKELLGSEVKFTGILGADMRVVPKGHVLFGAIEPIPTKPKLAAPRLDDE